jgi:hypothetical protein
MLKMSLTRDFNAQMNLSLHQDRVFPCFQREQLVWLLLECAAFQKEERTVVE